MIDNEDGTITDPRTGLTWEQAGSPKPYQQAAAIQYCTDLRLAGHTDWRLPELYELFSIIDHSRTNPAINPIFKAVANDYWSATTNATNPDYAWFVDFYNGGVYGVNKTSSSYVRAVRTGSLGPSTLREENAQLREQLAQHIAERDVTIDQVTDAQMERARAAEKERDHLRILISRVISAIYAPWGAPAPGIDESLYRALRKAATEKKL